MPELPIVSPGEIIASAHINDIADRTVQRYADGAERDLLNPTPTEGQLAFVASRQAMEIYQAGAWVPYIDQNGGTFTGDVFMGDGSNTGSVVLWVGRNVSSITRLLSVAFSSAASTLGHVFLSYQSDGVVTCQLRMADGEIEVIGTSSRAWIGLQRPGSAYQWRFAVGSAGQMLLQSSPDGLTWTTQDTWTP